MYGCMGRGTAPLRARVSGCVQLAFPEQSYPPFSSGGCPSFHYNHKLSTVGICPGRVTWTSSGRGSFSFNSIHMTSPPRENQGDGPRGKENPWQRRERVQQPGEEEYDLGGIAMIVLTLALSHPLLDPILFSWQVHPPIPLGGC